MKNNNDSINRLNPNWVTGLTDAEGCFSVSILKTKNKLGWVVLPSFQILLHIKDLNILLQIKSFFSHKGNITVNKKRNHVIYRIRDINSLINIIIPHFKKYPLISQKYSDYILFKDIVLLLRNIKLLNKDSLRNIVNLRASLNRGVSKKLHSDFPDIQKVSRSKANLPTLVNYNWLAGFFSGDGCFFIKILKSKSHSLGYSIRLRITITQHVKDEILMNKIAESLNCGVVYKHSKNAVVFSVLEFSSIYSIIIPLFKKYSILGIKSKDFEDFCKVASLIKEKIHLTKEGIDTIKIIKSNMNKGRLL